MKVLVVGEGGREHALVWALGRSPKVKELHAAPGNAGIGECAICTSIDAEDGAGLAAYATANGIDLAVIGPDGALAAGVVDMMEQAGIPAFGPTQAAARIEYSKSFAKKLMADEGIPTGEFAEFTGVADARDYLKFRQAPVVVKADGLAAGKGVVVCETIEEAETVASDMLQGNAFGAAGHRIVIEDFLKGEEASVFSITDGETVRTFVPSQDHKQIYDGDRGPNTGGMGAYAPAPLVSDDLLQRIVESVVEPALAGMRSRGCTYKGVLYTGLMIDDGDFKVVEFNSRFGDPETQVILPLLKNDFLDIVLAVCEGTLSDVTLEWEDKAATCVVLASNGYPGSYEKGMEICGLEKIRELDDIIAFHANTAERDGKTVTNGGRVVGITALAADLVTSIEQAYRACEMVEFDGKYSRSDIGRKAL